MENAHTLRSPQPRLVRKSLSMEGAQRLRAMMGIIQAPNPIHIRCMLRVCTITRRWLNSCCSMVPIQTPGLQQEERRERVMVVV